MLERERRLRSGSLCENAGDLRRAATHYSLANKICTDWESRSLLGWALTKLRRWDLLLRSFTELTEKRPDCALSRYFLGRSLVNLNRLHEAVVHLRAAVELGSWDSPWTYQELVIALRRLGCLTEAVEVGEEAISRYPGFPWLAGYVGNVLAELGETVRAAELQRHADKTHGWRESPRNGYVFTWDWFTHNIPVWRRHLDHLRELPTLHILEIGSFEGRSSCWILDNLVTSADSSLTCVDESFPSLFEANTARSKSPGRLSILEDDSRKILVRLKGSSFDVAYVDGCHSASQVLMDAEACWTLIKPGGIIIFDDYMLRATRNGARGPKHAIDLFLNRHQSELRLLHAGYQLIIQRLKLDGPRSR